MGERNVSSWGLGALSVAALALATLTLAAPAASYAAVSTSGPPHAHKRPKISGAAEDGRVLSVSEGTWRGSTPIALSYKWELCEHGRASCAPIAGAESSSYRVISQDVRHKLAVLVTATNSMGAVAVTSPLSKKVKEGSPLNLSPPEITGSLLEGAKLTASAGTWVGTAPFHYTYQWERCSVLASGCEAIEGATEPSYTPAPADLDSRLAVTVSAQNALGKASATSAETLPVEAVLPANIILPTITGLLKDGGLLAVEPGTWAGSEPISYSYVWQLCDSAGEDCSKIQEATEPTLKLLDGYVGDSVDVIVTAKNAAGSTSVTSSPTSLIAGLLPTNLVAPSITGSLLEGEILSLAHGEWSGSEPISYSYAWELCDALGQSCKEISGQAGPTLELLTSYIGDTIAGIVTAKNAAGEESATSSLTGLIKGIVPANTALPSISGGLLEGDLLKLSDGSWSGSEPISYSYAWELCNSTGGVCKEISGQAGSTLELLTGYIGDTIKGVVTATNVAGEASATSSLTGLIKGIVPANTALPSISGGLLEGDLLKLSDGSWSGSEPISYSYAWELCNSTGGVCKEISGQAGSTLELLTGYIGDTIKGVVTATNVAGEASATSSLTGLIKGIVPANTALPSISGGLLEGDELKLSEGKWSGAEPIGYSYAWELCNATGGACREISGQAGSTLELLTGYIGDTIKGVVTAKNVAGETSATSSLTGLIKGILPANTALPSISGGLLEGDELKLSEGKWSGTEPISYSYAWEKCNALGESCSEIKGQSGSALKLITEYIGATIEGVVTAKNIAGEASRASAVTELIKGIAPVNQTLPSILGKPIEGELLKASTGTWSGTEPITYEFQWQLCEVISKACSNLKGATKETLTLGVEDLGKLIGLVVTAKNVAGSTSATSALFGDGDGIKTPAEAEEEAREEEARGAEEES